jgi:hypothetical protein
MWHLGDRFGASRLDDRSVRDEGRTRRLTGTALEAERGDLVETFVDDGQTAVDGIDGREAAPRRCRLVAGEPEGRAHR